MLNWIRHRVSRIVGSLRAACAAIVFLALAPAVFAQGPAFVDSAQRSVALPAAPVVKVLAAGPPAAVVLYSLAPGKFMGWVRPLDSEALAYLPERYRSLPVQGRITGRNPADRAAVKALGPDVIVDFGTVNAAYADIATRTQAATGIPYVLIDGALSVTPAAFRTLGQIVQEPQRGEVLAARSQVLLDTVASKVGTLPGEARKRVYIARGPDGNETYGAGAFTDEIVSPAGGVNLAGGWGSGNLKDIAAERVREANPDVVIATDPYFLEVVARTPAWQKVSAIKAGHLYAAPRHPFGWIDEPPSINRLIGLRWLAGLLHPDRVDGNLREEVRDFFRTFYHAELSGPQLDKLLANAVAPKR